MNQEVEQLREALASARRLQAAESQRLREHELVSNGIRALSADDEPDILLARMFDLLSAALAFNEAYVLEPKDDLFVCGLNLPQFSTLSAHLDSLWGLELEISKTSKGENSYINFKRRLGSVQQGDGGVCDDDIPF